MKKVTLCIALSFLCGMTVAQESIKIVEVPRVIIKDSIFYQMVDSVVKDAEECPVTKVISCEITSKKFELQDNEYFFFSIEPHDDLSLFIESLHGTKSWRITTINDMPILFFFSDSNFFTVTDTSQIIINTKQWIKYEYIFCKDAVDISKQSPKSLCLKEEYAKVNGKYMLQYRSPCININGSEKKIKTGNKVLYIIKE